MQLTPIPLPDILAALSIDALNPMQEAALAANRKPGDVILLSQTGTGKTLAFLLPVLERMQPDHSGTQAIIVAPSRELAMQIETVWKNMRTGIKVTVCYGGHKREIEENNLVEAPGLIIGTPGRLADHLRRGNIRPETVHTLVLDEFDKCLELGFEQEINEVIAPLTNVDRRILVSATPPESLASGITLQDPQRIDLLDDASENILEIKYLNCGQKDKLQDLFLLLCMAGDRSSIVFCNHRESVGRTAAYLSANGITNVFYHGALEQRDRELALAKFRNGSVRTLVTTDLAARGLDIPNIRYIIHYHLPQTEESYIHRNGRTARVDKSGTVVLMKGPEETLPDFVPTDATEITLPEDMPIPDKPQWVTLCFGSGKKDKVNKIDIVGFLSHKGKLAKEDIGLIEVKDFMAFAAIRRKKANTVLPLIEVEKIKGKKAKVEIV
ncbi:MAG TPA: DEAD/DEAH box helicase [Phnomibacter sp.]|nr:DEAD/DEAH box helicase [Phnomibacter sp.]